jgi:multiple sugar transport system substrate-binding protein
MTAHRLGLLAIGLAATLSWGAPARAADLSIVCRCIDGGVNGELARWITGWVIPEYAKTPAGAGDTVALKQFGGTDEQLTQQLALDFSTGAGADISSFDGFLIPSFVEGGLLKPLDEIAGSEVDSWDGWPHISAGAQALMSYQGKRFGLAEGTDVRVIFYRRDLFQKAGLKADGWQPASWDELLATARALKKAAPDSFPLQINAGVSMGEATTMQGYYPLLLGAGEALQDKDGKWITASPAILAALKLYKTIYVDEKLGDQRAQLLADGRNRSFANFRDGKTAMLVEGDWFYRSVTAPGSEFAVADRDHTMAWAKIPAEGAGRGLDGRDFVTISGGTGFVLNPNTANPKQAWALLSFMNSQKALTAYQGFEERIRIRDDVPVPNSTFLQATAKALMPITTARPNDPNYDKVSAEAQRMTEAVVSGNATPEEAMARYGAAVKKIVGDANTVSKS